MSRTTRTAKRYFGSIASGYEQRRLPQVKWQREQEILKAWLARYPAGTKVFDCPVGTGRLIPFYKQYGFDAVGVDLSPDMLALARQKEPGSRILLREGSIFDTGEANGAYDVALAIRIVNLIEEADMICALKEMQRVSRQDVIFNVRVRVPNTRFKNPQKMSVIKSALLPGWRIAEDVEIHEPDFRMIRLCNG